MEVLGLPSLTGWSPPALHPQNCNYTYPDGWCLTSERYPGLFEVPAWDMEDAQGDALYSMDPGGDVLSVLKTNFDFGYNSNKVPFGIYIHVSCGPWWWGGGSGPPVPAALLQVRLMTNPCHPCCRRPGSPPPTLPPSTASCNMLWARATSGR